MIIRRLPISLSAVMLALLLVSMPRTAFPQVNFQDMTSGQAMFQMESAWGVAVADYDNDGDDDFYVTNLLGTGGNRLFRNDGNFSFTDASQVSGLGLSENFKIAVWLDSNNDGWLDILVGNTGFLKLYKNNRNGTFSEVTTGGFPFTSTPNGLLIGDLNGDQWLDIYCNNFLSPNQLLVNLGGNQFKNGIAGSGAEYFRRAMGGILYDYDHDGDLDIYLVSDANDGNVLFQNNGSRKFSDVTAAKNLTLKVNGMGVDIADFNTDGNYDLYITNLGENSLFVSQPNGTFSNNAIAAGVNDPGMTWGTICFDYNNDMRPDIFMVNDYSYSPYPNRLFRNNGDNTFSDVASGSPLEMKKNGHGCASGDFDLDGRTDLVVANSNGVGINVLKNNETTGNWLKLNLVGTTSNKFAVGAHVEAMVGSQVIMQDIRLGSGYVSQNSFTLNLGLGAAAQADLLTIRWPDGMIDQYSQIGANQRLLAVEKQSLTPFTVLAYQLALTSANALANPTDVPPDDVTYSPTASVARKWNEALLSAIRVDLARPNVHARNLFHTAIALYDAWAAYDDVAQPFLLNNTWGGFNVPFTGVPLKVNIKASREQAMSYAAFRLLNHRFANSPGAGQSLTNFQALFNLLGYDASVVSTDYSTGSPAALGNYIAAQLIDFGLQDGSNEPNNYANPHYLPLNPPLRPDLPGVSLLDANRWQPLKLNIFIDQNGNPQGTLQSFLGAEWGRVTPFALTEADLSKTTRDGNEYWAYHNPGPPPMLDTLNGSGQSAEYEWNYSFVSQWAAHLDPSDSVKIDISPAAKGNIDSTSYPSSLAGLHLFYKESGGDIGMGYAVNPKSNQPYSPQIIPRGDYARVLAEFWADGPKSETPPGHWFTILNYVNDQSGFKRKFGGQGLEIDPLEWDVKAYFVLGGAVHDAAISAWGLKGYYDGIRPVSAIRYLASKGQSTSPDSMHYHPAGIKLKKGFVELVHPGDPLAGPSQEDVGKIKLYTWRGPKYITDPKADQAGVGWILAENWYPYQRPTFVTPPFAGYISGHSTYSSAGAEVLTLLTGDEYFPNGMGQFFAPRNSFLSFEKGPSVDVNLQWARYKDAADQSALSRIWGGIHPPSDDMPGRFIGKKVGRSAFQRALPYFFYAIMGVEKQPPVELYPNPVRRGTTLNIILDGSESVSLEIDDLLGRRMYQSLRYDPAASSLEIDTSGWSPGVYILRAKKTGSAISRKIIVE